jgi:hypothetical protein
LTIELSHYWIRTGTCNAPNAGAVEDAIVLAATADTKHPLMLVPVVVAGSRYISANPSIVKLQLPVHP